MVALTVADIPIATGITDFQVVGVPPDRGQSGMPERRRLGRRVRPDDEHGVRAVPVGLTVRSNKTYPSHQLNPVPVLYDGHPYVAADQQYMYRAVNFRVAAIPRLDNL